MAAHIRLRREEFEDWCSIRGHRSPAAQARFIGVSDSHLSRILRGDRGIGGDFIAAVCAAFSPWRPHEKTFAALFAIDVEDECSDETGTTAA